MFRITIPGIKGKRFFKTSPVIEILVIGSGTDKAQSLYTRHFKSSLQCVLDVISLVDILTRGRSGTHYRVITIFNIRTRLTAGPVGRQDWLTADHGTEDVASPAGRIIGYLKSIHIPVRDIECVVHFHVQIDACTELIISIRRFLIDTILTVRSQTDKKLVAVATTSDAYIVTVDG